MAITYTGGGGTTKFSTSGTITADGEMIGLVGIMTHGSIGVKVSGTWAGTLTFEQTCLGTALRETTTSGVWVTTQLLPAADLDPTSGVTTTTSSGEWGAEVRGQRGFRVRWTTYTSGTPNIQINFLPSQN